MGLDAVELILAVEDAFQIHIPDEEASTASTAGDLYALVLSKLQGQHSKLCLTSAAFYQIRSDIRNPRKIFKVFRSGVASDSSALLETVSDN